jgi:hypothetical protein
MNIQTLSIILLVIEIIAFVYIVRVVTIQYPLLKATNDQDVRPLRYVLFFLALALLLGIGISIGVDIATIINGSIRSTTTINPLGLVYSLANSLSDVLSSVLLWLVYKVTGLATIKIEAEKLSLQKSNDKLENDRRKV